LQNSLTELLFDLVVGPRIATAASVAVAVRDETGWRVELGAVGTLGLDDPTPVGTTTLFDLASVTKPFFAATLVRALDPATRLGALLDEAVGTPVADTTLELLLAHRSGLEPHRTLFQPLLTGAPVRISSALREACLARTGDGAPVYSDLGYLLAGVALARHERAPLSTVVRREVLSPLRIEDVGSAEDWLRRDPSRFHGETAITEVVPWRGGALRSVVHDENAWALGGHGLSGHAGLFGTAEGVAQFGCAIVDSLLGETSWLDGSAIELLTRRRDGGTLRAGFDGVSQAGSAAGNRKSPETVGHLGFTGTSLWCDPTHGIVTVLLTNRVHPTRAHLGIRAARPAVEDALFDRVLASRD
jgi:CubicO group peptidase (beta-lactamase class C family)